ncbi:MAG: 30S ribosomal protein S8e [Candidatus Bathyarchaeota archaeon]|nr:30S ribosomal protein S8e [Candidatus Bathyarchaeota archaeon]
MVWNDTLTKRKASGGKKRPYRAHRIYEQGRHPVETIEGEQKLKTVSGRAGIEKIKIVRANVVNVSDPTTGKTEKLDILDVISNPANADYNRRGVITKGTIVRTEKGLARVISRPGQTGALSAIIYKE